MSSIVNNNLRLKEADRVEITTIVDNYTDILLESTKVVKRSPLAVGEKLWIKCPNLMSV